MLHVDGKGRIASARGGEKGWKGKRGGGDMAGERGKKKGGINW